MAAQLVWEAAARPLAAQLVQKVVARPRPEETVPVVSGEARRMTARRVGRKARVEVEAVGEAVGVDGAVEQLEVAREHSSTDQQALPSTCPRTSPDMGGILPSGRIDWRHPGLGRG